MAQLMKRRDLSLPFCAPFVKRNLYKSEIAGMFVKLSFLRLDLNPIFIFHHRILSRKLNKENNKNKKEQNAARVLIGIRLILLAC